MPDDDRITGIYNWAFAGNRVLRRIHLNSRVRYIGNSAFFGCTALEEIMFPASVGYVGAAALADCTSLKKAVLDCGVSRIPNNFFRHDISLESVIIPAGVTSIYSCAFYGCMKLKSVKPADAAGTEADAVIPPNVRELRTDAFTGCASLRSVWLPDSLKTIGRRAFKDCSSLQTIYTDTVEHYHAGCFQACGSLKEFTFGSRTKSLGTDIFTRSENLKKIQFSCAPDLECAADALPYDAEYTVDTLAYLKSTNPYNCRPLFCASVRNIVNGEEVPDEILGTVLRILRRNRKRNHEWFMEDERTLSWILNTGIPDCDDCTDMLKLAEEKDPVLADMIRAYTEAHFSDKQTAEAMEKWERRDQERKEAERKEREQREEAERREASLIARASAGEDLTLEEMILPGWCRDQLKKWGINLLSEVETLEAGQEWRYSTEYQAKREARKRAAYLRNHGVEPSEEELDKLLKAHEEVFTLDLDNLKL